MTDLRQTVRIQRMFTLLEMILVVVIAVAILAGFLLPMVLRGRGHRHHARRINCGSNLKQIGLALIMYSMDNQVPGEDAEYFIPTSAGDNFEPLNTLDILNDGKVYGCPSTPQPAVTARRTDYFYGGSGLRSDHPKATTTSIARDKSGNHPDNKWMNVLFVDGHVEGAKPDGSKGWNAYP